MSDVALTILFILAWLVVIGLAVVELRRGLKTDRESRVGEDPPR